MMKNNLNCRRDTENDRGETFDIRFCSEIGNFLRSFSAYKEFYQHHWTDGHKISFVFFLS
jgi:hypothetical protein